MISMGLGLEHIGKLAMRRPGLWLVFLLISCVFCGLQIPKVRFDGDITVVLPAESESFRSYREQQSAFRDFTRDVTLMVKSDRLTTAAGLEDLRGFQLELAVSDGIENVFSLFSVPRPNPQTGALENFFPQSIESDEQAASLIGELLAVFPQASSLVSADRRLATLIVTFSDLAGDDREANRAANLRTYADLKKAALAAAPPGFKLHFTGLTPISVTVISALVGDQLKLTLFGLILGAGIAFYVFRSAVGALVCAIPPALTAFWCLAVFGFFGIPITYLSTVLPTLALILAFADGIMIYYRWHQLNTGGGVITDNLAEAIRRVGPATSLTSITTFLAFLSFYFSPGSALKEFAFLGAAMVALAFLAVIVGMPVAGYWLSRWGVIRPTVLRKPAFTGAGAAVAAFVRPRARSLAIGGLVVVVALSFLHFKVRPEFRLTDYLPYESETRLAEDLANRNGGRAMLFMAITAAEPGTPFTEANMARLGEIEAAVATIAAPERIVSARALGRQVQTAEALAELDRQYSEGAAEARASYMSRDGTRLLVGIRIPSDQSIQTTLAQIGSLKATVTGFGYGKDVSITGFDVLMANEFTNLIQQMRNSLLLAILMGVAIIGIASRSFFLALATLTPNLLPILVIEMIVWLRGGGINMGEVIALTIAFGIAVDNAVHLLNVREDLMRGGKLPEEALGAAMTEVGPALVASCAIICTSAIVTQTSVLPMVPTVGALIIATLVIALGSNLAILPANIWSFERGGRKA